MRKEFIKRIFTYYIVKLEAGLDEDQHTPERIADGDIPPMTEEDVSELSLTASRVNKTLDRMDPKLIFMLYKRLAIDTRDKLA